MSPRLYGGRGWVRTENDAVIAFYAALGYGPADAVVMSKRLR